jgi:hypothetical protein
MERKNSLLKWKDTQGKRQLQQYAQEQETTAIESANEQTIKLTTQKGDEKDHNDNLTQQKGIITDISANKIQ